jgi:hypothetical protein
MALITETLERLLLESQSKASTAQAPAPLPNSGDLQGCLYHAAMLIANQIRDCQSNGSVGPSQTAQNNLHCGENSAPNGVQHGHSQAGNPRKRKLQDTADTCATWDRFDDCASLLPSYEVLELIINAYFSTVHHWVPFVHQRRFRARLLEPIEAQKMTVLLHGMTVVAFRQVDGRAISIHEEAVVEQIRVSRNVVMLNAMDGLSIENLQALALVAFDRVSSHNHISLVFNNLLKVIDGLG